MFSKVLLIASFAVVLLSLYADGAAVASTTSSPDHTDSTVTRQSNETVHNTTEKSANGITAVFAILPVVLKMVL